MVITNRRVLRMVVLGLVLNACGTLSVEDEKKLGHQAQRQVQQQFQLLREPIIVNYIRGIGKEVADASSRSVFDFRFYVIEDEEINAFAVPGGAIYVHTGLVQAAQSRAEIAGVLAHEIGHVTARHVAHLYNRQRNTGIVATVVTYAIAILSGNPYLARSGELATSVAAHAYLNTYTQDAEREADRIAVETLIRAGFDPHAMISMFETLQKESAGGMPVPPFLKSHPATAERIRNVRRLIQAHEPLPPGLRVEDRKLPIIQKRIKLVMGTDLGQGLEPE